MLPSLNIVENVDSVDDSHDQESVECRGVVNMNVESGDDNWLNDTALSEAGGHGHSHAGSHSVVSSHHSTHPAQHWARQCEDTVPLQSAPAASSNIRCYSPSSSCLH